MLALVAACGGSDDSGTTSERSPTTEDTTGQVGQDKSATDAMNYGIAYDICEITPPEQIRDELGAVSLDPVDLANAYADGYQEEFRQPNYEGCLDALQGEPKESP